MFQVSAAKEVVDPYEWLPSHGESKISFRSDGTDIVVDIAYEPDNGDPEFVKRELRFGGVRAFYWCAFPGAAGLLNVSYATTWKIGSLIEFERSDVADAWDKQAPGLPPARHFLIQFTSENRQLHAIAESYSLSGELMA